MKKILGTFSQIKMDLLKQGTLSAQVNLALKTKKEMWKKQDRNLGLQFNLKQNQVMRMECDKINGNMNFKQQEPLSYYGERDRKEIEEKIDGSDLGSEQTFTSKYEAT